MSATFDLLNLNNIVLQWFVSKFKNLTFVFQGGYGGRGGGGFRGGRGGGGRGE